MVLSIVSVLSPIWSLLPFLLVLYEFVYAGVWKCEVKGDEIKYRSLFLRRTVKVHDIKRVTLKRLRWSNKYGDSFGGLLGVNLYSDSWWKLFHISATKSGFRDFVIYLQEHDVPGAEDIPKGTR